MATPLAADTIYWSSPTAAPAKLGLTSVLSVNDSGMAVGNFGGQAAETSLSLPSLVVTFGLTSCFSTAVDIDDTGQIAIMSQDSSGHDSAFLWSASTGMTSLGTLGGSMAIPTAVNAAGQVVGQSTDSAGNLSAFVWSPGSGMSKIGDAGSQNATAINVWGEIAYQEDPYPYQNSYAAVGNAFSASALAFGTGSSSIAAINDSGWVVGTVGGQGFLSTQNQMFYFGAAFTPVDVNNSGDVLGSYQGRPVVWTISGGYHFLDLTGYTNASVTAINDAGEIVGGATASGKVGAEDGPASVPEPSALVLFLAGATLMAAGWHRRSTDTVARHPAPPPQPR